MLEREFNNLLVMGTDRRFDEVSILVFSSMIPSRLLICTYSHHELMKSCTKPWAQLWGLLTVVCFWTPPPVHSLLRDAVKGLLDK